MPVKKILILLSMLAVSLVSYYLFGKIIQAMCLLIIVALAVVINKDFLVEIWSMLKGKRKNS